MEALIKILKEFDENRENRVKCENWSSKTIEEKHKAIADWFRPCAESILCNGYFLINGEYIIDLGAIELYYHEEEEGGIKDYIMYHTNAHPSKSKVYKLNNDSFPYFKFGSFNLHQSGVDVTFENEEKKYRASFLIRSHRVLKTENGLYPENDDTKYDTHSTHIFDDMFYSGYGNTEIVWIPTDKKVGDIDELCPRINVAKYRINKNGKFEKHEIKSDDDEYNVAVEESKKDDSFSHYFKSSSKIYKRDMRKWQFKLKNIEEEKLPSTISNND
ncbi:MAG: hypothetical protein IKK36_04675 [Bacteroidales bacterium]|nr:hypothetical protein [Bacteroidales bacterium]MBR3945674.1 hypothetical protein [Bacteroidales bacterium]